MQFIEDPTKVSRGGDGVLRLSGYVDGCVEGGAT